MGSLWLEALGQVTSPQVLQRALLALIVWAPWLWLISFAVLAAVATLHLGRLPAYANPDPKNVPEIAALVQAAWVLLAPAILSPLAIGAYAVLCSVSRCRFALRRDWVMTHVAGFAAMAITIFGDPLGLSDWFFD